jgi:hypothetical protein
VVFALVTGAKLRERHKDRYHQVAKTQRFTKGSGEGQRRHEGDKGQWCHEVMASFETAKG